MYGLKDLRAYSPCISLPLVAARCIHYAPVIIVDLLMSLQRPSVATAAGAVDDCLMASSGQAIVLKLLHYLSCRFLCGLNGVVMAAIPPREVVCHCRADEDQFKLFHFLLSSVDLTYTPIMLLLLSRVKLDSRLPVENVK